MKKIALNLILGVGIFLFACEQDDPNIKQTNGKDIAGEWFVTYSVGGTDVGGGYSKIITSNTAANVASEMLISDYIDGNDQEGNFWSYKVKAQVNPGSKTFDADQVISSAIYDGDPYDIKVNILNGRIIPKGGLSKTGVVVDSIYFEIQFEDDAPSFGNTYVVSGHKRTGFAADEY